MIDAPAKRRDAVIESVAIRERILDAAFSIFIEHGFEAASTLAIATRARVSKRELYTLVGNKQQMLIACIGERAKRLQIPSEMPPIKDLASLTQVLMTFGAKLLREVTEPTVIAVFRLAISAAVRVPELAQALDSIGREASRIALRHIMTQALEVRLIQGRPAELAEQFSALLWGNLMVNLLLGVAGRPNTREFTLRARQATDAFIQLHGTAVRFTHRQAT